MAVGCVAAHFCCEMRGLGVMSLRCSYLLGLRDDAGIKRAHCSSSVLMAFTRKSRTGSSNAHSLESILNACDLEERHAGVETAPQSS